MKIKLFAASFLIMILGVILSFSGSPNQADDPGVLLRAAIEKEEVDGDLQGAIDLYKHIITRYGDHRAIAAKAQLHIGLCYEKLGLEEAQKAFQNVIDHYPEQSESVKLAREKLSLLLKAKDVVEKKSGEFQARQLRIGSDVDSSSGKVSPDGNYISYVDWMTGNLAMKEISTGKKTLLTKKGSWKTDAIEFAMGSVWSRDGKHLAICWDNDREKKVELYIVGLDDLESRLLYQIDFKNNWITPVDWSPDGKDVLAFFMGENRACQLGLISVKDGSIRFIKKFLAIDPHPIVAQFSPDGRYIAYEFPQEEQKREKNISIITPDGKNEWPLIAHHANDNLLGWSPDGNWILFSSDRTGTWDAWIIHMTEGKPQKSPQLVRRGIGPIHSLGFNQDGAFYYGVEGGMFDVLSATIDPESGHIHDMPEKEPLSFQGYNTYPDWSSDGKHLLYVSARGPMKRQRVLCIYTLESGNVREIDLKDEFVGFAYPRWCPDGRTILLFGEHLKSGEGIYAVDAITGEVTLLVEERDGGGGIKHWWPVMTFDGKHLFYDFEDSSEKLYEIRVREIETGKEKVLLRHPPHDNNQMVLSPDGKRLALILREEKNMRTVKVMPIEGGEPVELHRFELKGRNIVYLDWSPDGRYIYFPKLISDGWELWRVSATGGKAENLQIKMKGFTNLSIHPDGKRITFASYLGDEMPQKVWVMENFLPKIRDRE
jgi:Tol biopolymer transport system component